MHKVTLYATESCPFCKKAKDYLTSLKIPFTIIDVSLDQQKLEEMVEKSGQLGVPVIEINNRIIKGFNQKEIDRQLGKGAT